MIINILGAGLSESPEGGMRENNSSFFIKIGLYTHSIMSKDGV